MDNQRKAWFHAGLRGLTFSPQLVSACHGALRLSSSPLFCATSWFPWSPRKTTFTTMYANSEDFQVLAITTMVSSFVAEWYGRSAERHHEWRVMSLEIICNEISAVQQELLLKLEIKSIAMLEYAPKQNSEACRKQDHQNWRWSCFSDFFTNQMRCSEHGKYCDRAQIGRKSGL